MADIFVADLQDDNGAGGSALVCTATPANGTYAGISNTAANKATGPGSPAWLKAQTFDGVDNEITFASIAASGTSCTYKMFVYITGNQAAFAAPIECRGTTTNVCGILHPSASRILGYIYGNNSATYLYTGGPVIPTGKWVLIAVTATSGGSKFYVIEHNGTSRVTTVTTHAQSLLSSSYAQNPRIGNSTGGAGRYWAGLMAGVRIGNTAETQAQLEAFFDSALPVNTVAPAVTGTATVGSVLTAAAGTWSNGTVARQWFRDGSAISGETGSTYTLVTGDVGKTIRCRERSTSDIGFVDTLSNGIAIPENLTGGSWTRKLSATADAPAGSLTDFFFVAQLDSSLTNFWANVRSDGGDVRVCIDGVQVPCWIDPDTWNYGSTAGLLYFLRPGAASTAPAIEIFYGNASATTPYIAGVLGQYAVFPASVKAFYPRGGGNDCTVNVNNLTMTGSPTVGGVAGPISGSLATDYNGSTHQGSKTNFIGISTAPLSVVMSQYPDTVGVTKSLMRLQSAVNGTRAFFRNLSSTVDYGITTVVQTQLSGVVSASSWQNMVASDAGTSRVVYRQASSSGMAGGSGTATASLLDTLFFGSNSGGDYFDGKLAFGCFYNIALSANHVDYWHAMLDPSNASQSNFYNGWTDSSVASLAIIEANVAPFNVFNSLVTTSTNLATATLTKPEYDWSGISWKGLLAGVTANATCNIACMLISDTYAIAAWHCGPAVSDTIDFRNPAGTVYTYTVSAVTRLGGTSDLRLVKFSSTPHASLKRFRFLTRQHWLNAYPRYLWSLEWSGEVKPALPNGFIERDSDTLNLGTTVSSSGKPTLAVANSNELFLVGQHHYSTIDERYSDYHLALIAAALVADGEVISLLPVPNEIDRPIIDGPLPKLFRARWR